jgi:predicted nucleic acid-binding protein
MKLYFDACCVNRLTDDQIQPRIAREAEAVAELVGFASSAENVWVSSVVLEAEISRNLDAERRADAESLLTFARDRVKLDHQIVERARVLQADGFSEFDALHVACAESAEVQIFLTTDDRLVRKAERMGTRLAVRVQNPVSFLEEVRNANPRNV